VICRNNKWKLVKSGDKNGHPDFKKYHNSLQKG
jgi:hypothetical protein